MKNEVTPKYQTGTEVRFQASKGRRPRQLTGKIVGWHENSAGAVVYQIERPFKVPRTKPPYRQTFNTVYEDDIMTSPVVPQAEDAPEARWEKADEVTAGLEPPPGQAPPPQEAKRGCGYRKVGAMYLVGSSHEVPCDRLPYLLDVCPVCGAGVKVSRGFTKINPLALFGEHEECRDPSTRLCPLCDPGSEPGYIMLVGEQYYPTPEAFMAEARAMGISKRIPFIPDDLVLGSTPVYLAHHKACQLDVGVVAMETGEPTPGTFAVYRTEDGKYHANKMLNDERIAKLKDFREQEGAPTVYIVPAPTRREAKRMVKKMLKTRYQLGIFTAFVPQAVEKLIWAKDATPEELEKLERRSITPVIIPDGDENHA